MAFTVDWQNKIVHSSASITDIPITRHQLRDLEESEIGVLYPPILSYKEINLGGGATFPAIEFINGYTLQFPAGNYQISGGNLIATINPTAGVFIDRITSGSYAVTASGGSGVPSITKEEIREELDTNSVKLNELYRLQGLDLNSPLTITKSAISAGNIDIEISGSSGDISILTRQ